MLRRVIREPLLHFVILGGMLFGIHHFVAGKRREGNRTEEERRIVITEATIALLKQRYQRTWQRPPGAEELSGIIETEIRERILFREGVTMGLDRDDSVVRRRVLQKLDVLAGESAGQTAPGDSELQAYLEAHADRYAQPAIITFEQVLFDPIRHGDTLDADLAFALARLKEGAKPEEIGDRTLLPGHSVDIPADLVARDFGDAFAKAVVALPLGTWEGPVRSGFGLHFVRVARKTPGRPATLEEARAALARDWENNRRLRTAEEFYQQARAKYEITVEGGEPR